MLLTLLLTACGGGGGGGDTPVLGNATSEQTVSDTPDDDTATPSTPSLSLTIVDSTGADTNSVSGNSAVTLTATLLDAAGDAMVGHVVSFSSAVGELTPSSGNVLTETAGIAQISLGAGTTEDAGEAQASAVVDGVTIQSNSVGIESDGLGTGVSSSFLTIDFRLSTPDNSITVSRDNPGTATVTVTDPDGNGVDQAIVSFTTNAGVLNPVGGTISTGNGGTGIATISLLAGTTFQQGKLNAAITSGGETVDADPIDFITEGDGVSTIELSIPSGSRNVSISNTSPVTITATVIDSTGAPVLGSIVTFTNSGDGILSTTSDITNASGQATTNLLAGTALGVGSISASASVLSEAIGTSADGTISFDTAGDGAFDGIGTSNLDLSLSLRTSEDGPDFFTNLINDCVEAKCKVDANNPAIMQAVVLDASGVPLEDIIIEFATDGIGDVFPVNGLSLTNSNGVATASLNAGSVPGAGVASASIVIDGAKFDAQSLNFETNGNAGDAVVVLSSTFTDATPGNETNTITKEDSGSVNVIVQDDGGTDLPLRTATITTTFNTSETGTGATVSLSGGTAAQTITALSDSDGSIGFTLATDANSGSGTITVVVGDTQHTIDFEVSAAGLQIGTCSGGTSFSDCVGGTFVPDTINITEATVSAGGSTNIGLVVLDSGGAFVSDIDVSFTSGCSSLDVPLAKLSDDSPNSSGIVTGDYQADGCEGNDTITAVEASTGQTATAIVEVLPPNIGAIVFSKVEDVDGTETTDISIKESGGNSTAFVTFQVFDVLGAAAENQSVEFSLTSTVGGITLQNTTDITDPDGFATAILQAGFVATTVRIRASLDVDTDDDGDVTDFPDGAETLVTLSGQLSINTGIADQNSFSLAASSLSFEGGDRDGESVTLTVFLSDKFNNPVEDTTVQFKTEYGSVVSDCSTVDGSCDVVLTSTS